MCATIALSLYARMCVFAISRVDTHRLSSSPKGAPCTWLLLSPHPTRVVGHVYIAPSLDDIWKAHKASLENTSNATIEADKQTVCVLYSMVVHEHWRRRGLGACLLRQVFNSLSANTTVRWVYLSTWGSENVCFYKKCGFVVFTGAGLSRAVQHATNTGSGTDDRCQKDFEIVWMRKMLREQTQK